ncbi:MAG TPA: alpha/beta hydrolase [Mycobacteriales bacterium]|nr:alpha/beta hydrolase [Mycobacteriales bacterium]
MAHRLTGTHVFHPDLRLAARLLPSGFAGRTTTAAMRRAAALGRDRSPDIVEQVSETASVRVHRPASVPDPAPAVLWIHGGGLVLGTARQDDGLCRRFAAETGALVASVEYRLAPEHRFPAALEDCYAALTWLAAAPDIDAGRIAIAGGSAGGGLAAALAIMARDKGEIRPAFQLLVYPMLDDRTAARPDPGAATRRLWNNRANRYGWASYLGREPGSDGVSSYAAPARCSDLAGLPPAWIGVGSVDLFHDEDVEYARRLTASGVPCRLDVVDGAFHGFDYVAGAAVARRFADLRIEALRAGLTGTPQTGDGMLR